MARLVERPAADRHDQAGLLGHRDELRRRDDAPLRVAPADQRLEALHPPGRQLHDRLEVEHELLALDRTVEVAHDPEPGVGLVAHGEVEDLEPGVPQRLGAVHGDVGVAEQILGLEVAGRAQHRADARRGHQVPARDAEWRRQGLADPRRGVLDVVRTAHLLEHDGELVSAQARDHVARPERGDQAPGDADEKLVPGLVAQAVVDELEVVEVEVEHREPVARLAPGALQRAGDAFGEEGPVGEVGQSVVQRGALQPGLVLLALGDVPRDRGGADDLSPLIADRRDGN